MEDKRKKVAGPIDGITQDRRTNCIDHPALPGTVHLVPIDYVGRYTVRPRFYEINGATTIPGGVSFTVYSHGATNIELLLFRRTEEEPYAVLPFPRHYRIDDVYSMIMFRLDIGEFEYAYRVDGPYEPEEGFIFDKTRYPLDPYARTVTGQSRWGGPLPGCQHYKTRVVRDDFDWADMAQPLTPMEDLVIYELHVRGFAMHGSSAMLRPGTLEGLVEELPYLPELGVSVVELMPIFKFDEMQDYRETDGRKLYNCWRYSTVSFFSPNISYAAGTRYNREGNGLKNLIQVFNRHEIEIYLDMVLSHTAEGDRNGPFFLFKRSDNNIHYLLTPERYYYNFSGCGNTLNYNHPTVQQMILNCLRYWVTAYRINGFRFDPASIMERNEGGTPISKPPLLQSLTFDPVLGDVKLIAEAWDVDGLYQVGVFSSWNYWAEWNDRYRDDMHHHIKGDQGMAQAAALRIAGSEDTYTDHDRKNASVDFIARHDGFILYDLFSYSVRHDGSNGWNGTDGANDNNSWNCGAEEETDDPRVEALRRRMVRNACVLLMCSRGIPMSLAGDEFCNAQFGNNNAYCQDSEISWLDWGRLGRYRDVFSFFQYMIRFRKTHRLVRTNVSGGACGFPDVSFRGVEPWYSSFAEYERYVGVIFADRGAGRGPQTVYITSNAYWEGLDVGLPVLPDGTE